MSGKVKVILLFEKSMCPDCGSISEYREYVLNDSLVERLSNGGQVSIVFSDPEWSEIFWAQGHINIGEVNEH